MLCRCKGGRRRGSQLSEVLRSKENLQSPSPSQLSTSHSYHLHPDQPHRTNPIHTVFIPSFHQHHRTSIYMCIVEPCKAPLLVASLLLSASTLSDKSSAMSTKSLLVILRVSLAGTTGRALLKTKGRDSPPALALSLVSPAPVLPTTVPPSGGPLSRCPWSLIHGSSRSATAP